MTRNLTQGNIGKQLYLLSKPYFIGVFSVISLQLCDSYFLSLYGNDELAAMTFSYPIFSIIIALFIGLSNGSSVILSPLVGSNARKSFRVCNTHILFFSVTFCFLFLGFLLYNLEYIIHFFAAEQHIKELSYQYLGIVFIGLFFLFITLIINGSLKSLGYAEIVGRSMYISSIINLIMDPLLIFGIGPFPEMGIKGAALATVIGWFCSFLFILLYAKNKKLFHIGKRHIGLFMFNVKRWLKQSTATTVTHASVGFINLFSIFFLSKYGSHVLAGFGLAYRFEKLSLLFAISLSSAVMIFCGQNLGDKNYDRILKGISIANKSLFIVMGLAILSCLSLVFMDNIIPLKKDSFEVFSYYLIILLTTTIFHGYTTIQLGILNGLQKARLVFVLNLVKCFIVVASMTLAYFFFDNHIAIFSAIAASHFIVFFITTYHTNKVTLVLKQHGN